MYWWPHLTHRPRAARPVPSPTTDLGLSPQTRVSLLPSSLAKGVFGCFNVLLFCAPIRSGFCRNITRQPIIPHVQNTQSLSTASVHSCAFDTWLKDVEGMPTSRSPFSTPDILLYWPRKEIKSLSTATSSARHTARLLDLCHTV